MQWLELPVWVILLGATIFSFITWLVKKREYTDGAMFDTREVVALYTVPRVVIAWTAILIAFLFVDFNKLFLIVIFPVVYFIIMTRMAKKVLAADEERLRRDELK